jgi:hypothetical protein
MEGYDPYHHVCKQNDPKLADVQVVMVKTEFVTSVGTARYKKKEQEYSPASYNTHSISLMPCIMNLTGE